MISGLNHITLAVTDVDRSFDFYSRVLGFTPMARGDGWAHLTVGDTWIALIFDEHAPGGPPPDYSHIAFTCCQGGFEGIKARILESGVSEWQRNRTEGDSLYFCDPDGRKLELHVGDLQSRMQALKKARTKDMVFFV